MGWYFGANRPRAVLRCALLLGLGNVYFYEVKHAWIDWALWLIAC